MQTKRKNKLILFITLIIIIFLFLFPFYWMLKSSLEQSSNIYNSTIIPKELTLNNFKQLLLGTTFLTNLKNSLIIAIVSTFLTTVLATLGGYGLARYRWRGKKLIARSILFAYMFPAILLGIPYYIILKNLHLLGNFTGIILAHITLSLPFSIWMLWQFFQTVPRAYEESAWVSGASRLRTLVEIVFPQAKPGVMAVIVFAFANSWNDYTFSYLLLPQQEMHTLPIAVSLFVQQTEVNWPTVQAANLLLAIPGFLLILFFQKYLLKGFESGGVKG